MIKEEKYEVKIGDQSYFLNNDLSKEASIYKESADTYSIIKDFKSRKATILDADPTNPKNLKVEVDGILFNVQIKTALEQMLDKLGLSSVSTKLVKDIKAPMPGLVLKVDVVEGQQVKEGDKLLILEAMKMENSIMIHADATIKKVNVKPGDAVEKGQVLVELE